jgi:8-oxo-dGTP pyrophosphatase MutT (NUDIX family)
MKYPPLVASNAYDRHPYPIDFITAHRDGIPHRAVHIVVRNERHEILVWRRGESSRRWEVIGGHVDYLSDLNRCESYEEAALRELCEELNLAAMWRISAAEAMERVRPNLVPLEKTINLLPSEHGNNAEHVVRFEVLFPDAWGDPCTFDFGAETHTAPRWLALDQLVELCLENPNGINSALRLFLMSRRILVPIVKPLGTPTSA